MHYSDIHVCDMPLGRVIAPMIGYQCYQPRSLMHWCTNTSILWNWYCWGVSLTHIWASLLTKMLTVPCFLYACIAAYAVLSICIIHYVLWVYGPSLFGDSADSVL